MTIEDVINDVIKRSKNTRLIFGYPVGNGFYSNIDKEKFSNVVNDIYYSNQDCDSVEKEGHYYYLDNLKFESYFNTTNSSDKCYRESVIQLEDFTSYVDDFGLPDTSQISSKSPIGFRIENFEKSKVNNKDFPPSNQYHHIESFSKMLIRVKEICDIEFLRIKDITDNIITHQILLYLHCNDKDNVIRLLSIIDKIISLINPNQNKDPQSVRKIVIKDLR